MDLGSIWGNDAEFPDLSAVFEEHDVCHQQIVLPFETRLGWMAVLVCNVRLYRLTLGHGTPNAAVRASEGFASARVGEAQKRWHANLIQRLESFSRGKPVDFSDIELDLSGLTKFRRRIVTHCRRIEFGQTVSYGTLAACAGSPRAARAVGNAMSRNHCPLIVPCHRVVGSGGALGGFSAPRGVEMKRRLLRLEGIVLPTGGFQADRGC